MCPFPGINRRVRPHLLFYTMKHLSLSAILFITILISLPVTSAAASPRPSGEKNVSFQGIDVDSLVRAVCREEGYGRIGGIWSATTDGANVGIVPAKAWIMATGITPPENERTFAEQWLIILLDNPDPYLQPGTLMGWISPAAKPDYYNARIFTRRKGSTLTSPHQFILHLADDGHMTMKGIRKGIEINPWRLLPYMIRGTIKWRDETPRDLDGFLKKWPVPHNPQNPRSL